MEVFENMFLMNSLVGNVRLLFQFLMVSAVDPKRSCLPKNVVSWIDSSQPTPPPFHHEGGARRLAVVQKDDRDSGHVFQRHGQPNHRYCHR